MSVHLKANLIYDFWSYQQNELNKAAQTRIKAGSDVGAQAWLKCKIIAT